MAKQAISVTLEHDNLVWLRGRSRALGHVSVSALLDRLVTEARTGGRSLDAPSRSVIGTVRIAVADPGLETADEAVQALFRPAEQKPGTRAGPARLRARSNA